MYFIFLLFHMKIKHQEFILDNGLRLLVHEDHSIPIAAVNLLYNVGSKDEDPRKTGFAHLFEHLMFGGSANIPSYDESLQKVGGENNAFTTPDLTNYYLTVPANNLETAFWLESDRMLSLSFKDKVLEVQRKVVIEEFKQRYLNQPYGDVWLKIRPLAYKTHPYQWPTIGKDISHIENVSIDDVREFFRKFYIPNNANLVVAGDVRTKEVKQLADKWFGPVPPGKSYQRKLPEEPVQQQKRMLETTADVPSGAVYMAWHMNGRLASGYHAADLLSDILGRGKASRLYRQLVRKEKVFQSINAYITGNIDPGLLVISGKLRDQYSPADGEKAILDSLGEMSNGIGIEEELQNAKTQAETSIAFMEVEIVSRAMNLAYFTNLGSADLYHQEKTSIQRVSPGDILQTGRNILQERNLSVLYYHSERK